MLNNYHFIIWLQNKQIIEVCVKASSKHLAKKKLEEIYKDARLILNYKIT